MATTTTNIKINIVEPGDSTPVDPVPMDPADTTNITTYITSSTDISTPDTGLFTHGIGSTEATIITISIVTILAVVATVLHYKKKHNKATESSSKSKLTNIISTIKSKKKVSIPLAILALVVSLGTLATLLVNAGKSNTNAAEGNTKQNENSTSSLTLDVDSEELTIEVGDTPVFAYLPVKLTVEEATQAGYTLTAYTDNTDLVSTTDPNDKIPMVTVEGDELTTLEDNTWGLALDNEPTAKDNKVYKTLSTDQANPTLITDKDYSETEANDTTTIYYGFYIAPDIPYGTYTGGEVEYEATQNRTDLATVIFDGNGLYFNGDEARTNNVVMYDTSAITPYTEKYSYTPNLNGEGEVLDNSYPNRMYPVDSDETFVYEFPGADKIKVNIVKTDNDGCPKDENDYFTF